MIATLPPHDAAKKTILAVDDARSNLHTLVTSCAKQGYLVRPASCGTSALKEATGNPPDLILLDIDMPGMDGYEVCQRLKADPRLKSVPVIFISAHSDQLEKVKAFSVGAVDYVTKPFQLEELHARIAMQLYLRDLQTRLEQANAALAETNSRIREDLTAEFAERKDRRHFWAHILGVSVVGTVGAVGVIVGAIAVAIQLHGMQLQIDAHKEMAVRSELLAAQVSAITPALHQSNLHQSSLHQSTLAHSQTARQHTADNQSVSTPDAPLPPADYGLQAYQLAGSGDAGASEFRPASAIAPPVED